MVNAHTLLSKKSISIIALMIISSILVALVPQDFSALLADVLDEHIVKSPWQSCRTEHGITKINRNETTTLITPEKEIQDITQTFILSSHGGPPRLIQGGDFMVTAEITEEKTLKFTRTNAPNAESKIAYTVVECFNNEFHVERGDITLSSREKTTTKTINESPIEKSFVTVSARTNENKPLQHTSLINAHLKDSKTLEISRSSTFANELTARYQIITFPKDVIVQTNEIALSPNELNVIDKINSSNPDNTLLLCTWDADTPGLAQNSIGCELKNSTTVQFHRGKALEATNNIRYHAITFPSKKVLVQRGNEKNTPPKPNVTRFDHDVYIDPISSVTKAFSTVTTTATEKNPAHPYYKWVHHIIDEFTLRTSLWHETEFKGDKHNQKYWQVVEFLNNSRRKKRSTSKTLSISGLAPPHTTVSVERRNGDLIKKSRASATGRFFSLLQGIPKGTFQIHIKTQVPESKSTNTLKYTIRNEDHIQTKNISNIFLPPALKFNRKDSGSPHHVIILGKSIPFSEVRIQLFREDDNALVKGFSTFSDKAGFFAYNFDTTQIKNKRNYKVRAYSKRGPYIMSTKSTPVLLPVFNK